MKQNIEGFLKDYDSICKKYNVSLAHEDCYGAFIIQEYDEENIEWVEGALIQSELDEQEAKRDRERKERFENYYNEMKELVNSGINIVETVKGDVKRINGELKWVPSVFKVFDNDGNELREATRDEISKVDWIHVNVRRHNLYYDHHEDGANVDLKETIEWYEKYK